MGEKKPLQSNIHILFLFVTVVFIIASLLGYLNGSNFIWMLDLIMDFFSEGFSEITPFELFAFIFINNTVKSFLVIPLGAVLAIPPLIFIFFNGFIIGIVGYGLSEIYPSGILFLFIGILPHGIIELIAVFWSSAISLRVGISTINKLRGREKGNVKIEIITGMRTFVLKILPLLLLAALIEAFITPEIINIYVA